jgi:hypothetical protein
LKLFAIAIFMRHSQMESTMKAPLPALLLLPAPLLAQSLETLPLDHGFYVRVEAPCAVASAATLTLHHPKGLLGLMDFCRFDAITQTGPDSYSVIQTCGPDEAQAETDTVIYELTGRTQFKMTSPYGWDYTSRLCPQSDLPDPFNAVDLPELLGQL